MARSYIPMLDEPSLGLPPRLPDFIFDAIRNVRQKVKFSILLVGQRAEEALELCEGDYIMASGRITMTGNREELIKNPKVQEAYLGTA